MRRFLKNFIVIPLVLVAIILTGWSYSRHYLSEENLNSTPAHYMDVAVAFSNDVAGPVLSPFQKLLRPVLGRVLKKDYSKDVYQISVKQLQKLIQVARNKDYKGVLIYLYSFDCSPCSINYSDINALAAEFDKTKMLTLAIAVDTTPQELSDYMNISSGLPNFKPFVLKKGEEVKLNEISYFIDSDYSKPPYIAVISENGRLVKLPQGLGRGDAIRAKLNQMLNH